MSNPRQGKLTLMISLSATTEGPYAHFSTHTHATVVSTVVVSERFFNYVLM